MIELIDAVSKIITGTLIPLAFALCLLYFFWGVAKYIRSGAGGANAAKEGKQVMVYGIIGLFVAFSIWGIITFIKSELGLPPVENPNPENPHSEIGNITPVGVINND
jgi:hypothetical protein